MILKSGLIVSDTVNITKQVFHIETQHEEIVLCNLEDAYNLIKNRQCFYASKFNKWGLTNISENDIINMFEGKNSAKKE